VCGEERGPFRLRTEIEALPPAAEHESLELIAYAHGGETPAASGVGLADHQHTALGQ